RQAKFFAPADAGVDPLFGASVAIWGDTMIVGVDHADQPGTRDCGAAYVFTRSGATWTQQAKLSPADATLEGTFGHSVAIRGDTAVVGSPLFSSVNGDTGWAYVYTRAGATWTQTQRLSPSVPNTGFNNFFGT